MSKTLLEAIRAEARPNLWANGVKLAAAKAAVLEKKQGAEYVFRVQPPNKPVPYTIFLTPEDAWECSCDGAYSPCEHVVAAAITLADSAKKG